MLGEFLSAHGFVDAAVQSFHSALEHEPGNPAMLGSLIQNKRVTSADDPDYRALEQAFSRSDALLRARDALAFAMGKATGELGDHRRAFDYFSEGNRLRRAAIDYSIDVEARQFARIREASPRLCTTCAGRPSERRAHLHRRHATLGHHADGAPSGHPDVYGAGRELDFIRAAATAALGFDPLEEVQLFGAPGRRLDFAAAGRTYLDWLPAEAKLKPRVTDKMPHNFRFVGLIRLVFPNARIVHVRRDPLDNCLSIFKTLHVAPPSARHDLTELGRYYNLYRHTRHCACGAARRNP